MSDGWPGDFEREECPEGHCESLQTPWGGSRAAFICTVCKTFWGEPGIGVGAE